MRVLSSSQYEVQDGAFGTGSFESIRGISASSSKNYVWVADKCR